MREMGLRTQHLKTSLKKVLKKIGRLPWWFSAKESACQRKRYRFDPWSRKTPHALEQFSPCSTAIAEKAMATHSSTLAWKIPWMEEPGRLQSMGSLRVGHDWTTSLSFFTFMHWRRKWQHTPVFLPGESQGWGACWAAVYGVAQSQTRLTRLSSSSSHNYWDRALEPKSCKYWRLHTLKPVLHKRRTLQWEALAPQQGVALAAATIEKPTQQQRPSVVKNK